jgi:hypothetical protein
VSQPVVFHAKDPATGWLSNFHPVRITLDGESWPSVEHYYQAQKYADPAVRKSIRAAADAAQARKLGQSRSLLPRADWEAIKVSIMTTALRAKFTQHRAMAERLRATGDAEIVHRSSTDLLWGRNSDGLGENLLGQLLMAQRAELASG